MIGLEQPLQYKAGAEGVRLQDQSPCSDLIKVTPHMLQVQPNPMNRVNVCFTHHAGTGVDTHRSISAPPWLASDALLLLQSCW